MHRDCNQSSAQAKNLIGITSRHFCIDLSFSKGGGLAEVFFSAGTAMTAKFSTTVRKGQLLFGKLIISDDHPITAEASTGSGKQWRQKPS